jgi:hypothetical protein
MGNVMRAFYLIVTFTLSKSGEKDGVFIVPESEDREWRSGMT